MPTIRAGNKADRREREKKKLWKATGREMSKVIEQKRLSKCWRKRLWKKGLAEGIGDVQDLMRHQTDCQTQRAAEKHQRTGPKRGLQGGQSPLFRNLKVTQRKLSGSSELLRSNFSLQAIWGIYKVDQRSNYPPMSSLPNCPKLKDLHLESTIWLSHLISHRENSSIWW